MLTPEHELRVVMVKPESLLQHPENANNGDVDALNESVEINGFYQPVIVQDSTRFVLAGNHRLLVALKRGMREIPAIFLNVGDDQARRIMVADNRITRLGYDDEGLLANILEQLHDTGIGLAGTGYDPDDYSSLMAMVNEPLTEADMAEPNPDDDDSAPLPGRLQFTLMPVVDDHEGKVYEVSLARSNMGHITARDFNILRKRLGQEPLTREELDTYNVPNWEQR